MADLMVPEIAKEMKKDLHWMLALEYIHLAASIGFTVTTSEVKKKKTFYFTNIEIFKSGSVFHHEGSLTQRK